MFRDTYFSLLFLFFIRHIILDFLYFDSSHLVFLTYCSTYPLLKNKINVKKQGLKILSGSGTDSDTKTKTE